MAKTQSAVDQKVGNCSLYLNHGDPSRNAPWGHGNRHANMMHGPSQGCMDAKLSQTKVSRYQLSPRIIAQKLGRCRMG